MFEHYLSAGFFCGIAASLSKFGLRSSSGPFDWCFSDLPGVVHFLENGFADFLDKNNLEIVDGKEKEFKDIKYGIHFNHDIKDSFETEVECIREKYNRRIKKYLQDLSEGACLIRVVRDEEELEYLFENASHIKEVVKKYNSDNDIVYIVLEQMNIPKDFTEKVFPLKIDEYRGTNYDVLRTLFDTNQDFIYYCIDNYDETKRETNLIFDIKKEHARLSEKVARLEKDCDFLKTKVTGLEEGRDFWKDKADLYKTKVGDIQKDKDFLKTKVTGLEEGRDFWKDKATSLEEGRDFWKDKATSLEEGRDFWKDKATSLEEGRDFWKDKATSLEEGRDFWKDKATSLEKQRYELSTTLSDYQSSLFVRISYKLHQLYIKLKKAVSK